MNVIFHDAAAAEIIATTEWFDDQQRGLGDEFKTAFDECVNSICFAPESFARYELLRSRLWNNVHRVVMRKFLYIVVFEVRLSEIRVLAVDHAHRRPNYWFKRLLSE